MDQQVLQQNVMAIAQGIMLILGAIMAIWSKGGIKK